MVSDTLDRLTERHDLDEDAREFVRKVLESWVRRGLTIEEAGNVADEVIGIGFEKGAGLSVLAWTHDNVEIRRLDKPGEKG